MAVDIRPPHCKHFQHKQPKGNHPVIAPLPTSAMLLASTGKGKTTLLVNLLLNPRLYRDCFSRIYCFELGARGRQAGA